MVWLSFLQIDGQESVFTMGKNTQFKTFHEFKEKIRAFFNETWGMISGDFRTRINDNFQILKPVL